MDTNPPSSIRLSTLFFSFFFTFMNTVFLHIFSFLSFKVPKQTNSLGCPAPRWAFLGGLALLDSMKSYKHLPPG